MKKLITSLCVVGLIASVGCNTSTTGGRTPTTSSTGSHTTMGNKESFKLSAPTMSTSIKQGTSEKVKVSISRGHDFKDNVKLTAKASDPKLHVTMEPTAFRGSETKDVEVTIHADDDAKVGDATVNITGIPEAGGHETTVAIPVTVKAKESNK